MCSGGTGTAAAAGAGVLPRQPPSTSCRNAEPQPDGTPAMQTDDGRNMSHAKASGTSQNPDIPQDEKIQKRNGTYRLLSRLRKSNRPQMKPTDTARNFMPCAATETEATENFGSLLSWQSVPETERLPFAFRQGY